MLGVSWVNGGSIKKRRKQILNILVLNCGSSSLKFQLITTDAALMKADQDKIRAKGVIERIGSQCLIAIQCENGRSVKLAKALGTHRDAIDFVLKWLASEDSGITEFRSLQDIHAVGHRVVHGGEHFQRSVRIDAQVLAGIEDCIELAPLHNPANLSGIRAIKELLGDELPQVAVFDTAFHASMPENAYLYALPYQYYRRYKIRRYGFHGTSHRYISYRYRRSLKVEKEQVKIITLHLGNGCSICAIDGGQSVLTSMGMTPLEGLVMGTRSGDLDPAIIEYLAMKEGIGLQDVDTLLNKQSGLIGISGLTNDMRELLEEEREKGDRRATLAIDIFCQRVCRYIGAYLAHLNGADALIFSGGIGENAPAIRQRIAGEMEWLGIKLDQKKNQEVSQGQQGLISTDDSRMKVMVIPTNEELLIARDAYRVVHGDLDS